MNNLILMGRMTKNPELKFSTSGKAKCNFNIAVTKKYKKDEADFVNCIAWDKTAENISNFFKKGDRILIHGRLSVTTFQDNGENRWLYEVIVEEFEFIEKKENREDDKNVLQAEGE